MKDPDLEKFLSIKEDVIDNILEIQTAINDCTDNGMLDPGDVLYNQVADLLSQAEATDTLADLEMIVVKAKDIEKMVDAWLSTQGTSSFELTWPETFKL